MNVDYIKCGDCTKLLRGLPDQSIDLVVTSPPYDNLREYNGYSFDFESVARELLRVVKQGGIVVWIVSDATIGGSETGTSFRQALYFKDIGFNIHDTMIWQKDSFSAVGALATRYAPVFEYMFVFTKGKIKTFNPIKDRRNKWSGTNLHGTVRCADGTTKQVSGVGSKQIGEYGQRFNVWQVPGEKSNKSGHPAPFPVALAKDHILSWSNQGDIVLDPFMGSGTTAIACIETDRSYIGFDISEEYCNIAQERIENHYFQRRLELHTDQKEVEE